MIAGGGSSVGGESWGGHPLTWADFDSMIPLGSTTSASTGEYVKRECALKFEESVTIDNVRVWSGGGDPPL